MNIFEITAPVAGIVNKIVIKKDQQVLAGDVAMILEVMKMENELLTEKSGTVSEISVEEGAMVAAGQVLAKIQINE
ncbi:MAG: acetyl-CoA carboxylase biotin carboxyl carrier protein subunit [Lactobacillaceae bacterium]|jgi:acetyl-CoA/propionyl-CoA carboxylase biotin carboxyl carrier protein|nr:acetyl-CoA carboxylase biotin carboxyl carrier protein subunit [Lactobacillaceae bacterium]